MAFASDMSYLFVAVKGRMPTDLNNPTGQFQPGFIAAYAITGENRMTLASEPVKTSAAVPFSIKEDFGAEGVYFSSDAATGYAAFRFGSEAKAVPGTIPNAAAVSLGQPLSILDAWASPEISPSRIAGSHNPI